MYKRHAEGQICETILMEYLLRREFYVFRPQASFGPVDVIAISSRTGKVYLLDAKKERLRYFKVKNAKGRGIKYGPHRIHRVRSKEQKVFGVHIAYVNMDTRGVHIVPAIEGEGLNVPKRKKT